MILNRTTIFAILLMPWAGAATAASERVIYSFGGISGSMEPASGRNPEAGLLATQGGRVFYGTASAGGLLAGGAAAGGTLYQISRAAGTKNATFTVLHSFDPATEGNDPTNVPVTDGKSFYGTLAAGPGAINIGPGTVYRWTPPQAGQATGTLTILHVFGGAGDGSEPTGGLTIAANGTLYGTTATGGAGNAGNVWSLTPPVSGQSSWTYTVLHDFNGADGTSPGAALVADQSGNLYGSTGFGGPAGHGTIFKLQPPSSGQGAWTLSTIAGFTGATAPSEVSAPLVFDPKGDLFGTSLVGGAANDGTVFELVPPAAGGAAWTTTTLFSFSGANGRQPGAPLVLDSAGTLYGTTQIGGAHNTGTVFSLAPPAIAGGAWQETVLLDFLAGSAPKGAYPNGGLAFTANHQFISTTSARGVSNGGVIFLLKP